MAKVANDNKCWPHNKGFNQHGALWDTAKQNGKQSKFQTIYCALNFAMCSLQLLRPKTDNERIFLNNIPADQFNKMA